MYSCEVHHCLRGFLGKISLFSLIKLEETTQRWKKIADFPCYQEARRCCRRLKIWYSYHKPRDFSSLEVTRLENGIWQSLSQPSFGNYGRIVCNEEGYQTGFIPLGFLNKS